MMSSQRQGPPVSPLLLSPRPPLATTNNNGQVIVVRLQNLPPATPTAHTTNNNNELQQAANKCSECCDAVERVESEPTESYEPSKGLKGSSRSAELVAFWTSKRPLLPCPDRPKYFFCPLPNCPVKFLRNDLGYHFFTLHDVCRPVLCPQCPCRFTKEGYLYQHRKLYH